MSSEWIPAHIPVHLLLRVLTAPGGGVTTLQAPGITSFLRPGPCARRGLLWIPLCMIVSESLSSLTESQRQGTGASLLWSGPLPAGICSSASVAASTSSALQPVGEGLILSAAY